MKLKSNFFSKITDFLKFPFLILNDNFQSEISLIESYFEDDRLLNFNSRYNDLLSKKSCKTPFTYWGINFKDEKIHSIKFYAHVLDEVSKEEMKNFIPTTKDYCQFLSIKSEGTNFNLKNLGTALELKFIISRNISRTGFFFMVNNLGKFELNNTIDFPKQIAERCVAKGINFEYEGNKSFRKNYYYFNSSDCRHFFEKIFSISIPNQIDIIEYSQFDLYSKINFFGSQMHRADEATDYFTKNEKKIIKYFNKKYKLFNFEFGIYDHKNIKSVYFFDKKGDDFPKVNTFKRLLK